jgi:hypothetical protein
MAVSRLLPAGGANDFNVAVGGSYTSVTFDKEYSPGAYTISSAVGDTTFDIYAYNASGALAGYTKTPSLITTLGFIKIVILGGTTADLLSFSYKTTYTSVDDSDEVTAGPVATSVTPSAVPKVDDTFTLTGRNFASNCTVTFTSANTAYTATQAKNIVRSSATSLIVTRPDNLPTGYSPYTLTVQNPGVSNPTGSNVHILANGITAGVAPVWVTGSVLSYNTGASTSLTLSATDADAGSDVDYSIVSGTLPTGLSLDGETGVISGTPSTSQQTVTFRATDQGGNFVDKAIKFNAHPIITTTSLPGFGSGIAYSQQLVATDDLSTSSITWSLTSGSLVSGLTLSSSGLISGTPTNTSAASFTVTATDGDGGTKSQALTHAAAPIGGTLYQSVGTYTWTVPSSVTSISVVAIGGGGGGGAGNSGHAGAGAGLGWKNNISVTPGQTYTVVVGGGGNQSGNSGAVAGTGGTSYFNTTSVVRGGGGQGADMNPTETYMGYSPAAGGTYTGDGGGNGGAGGYDTGNNGGSGGGGAGGYSGNGGFGAHNGNSGAAYFASGAGSGGGAGGGGRNADSNGSGAGGGGTGIYGQGSNGASITARGSDSAIAGQAGSNGTNGGGPPLNATSPAGNGGSYGGGGGGSNQNYAGGTGGNGAVRIVWGPNRSFPSTNVGQNYGGFSETVI